MTQWNRHAINVTAWIATDNEAGGLNKAVRGVLTSRYSTASQVGTRVPVPPGTTRTPSAASKGCMQASSKPVAELQNRGRLRLESRFHQEFAWRIQTGRVGFISSVIGSGSPIVRRGYSRGTADRKNIRSSKPSACEEYGEALRPWERSRQHQLEQDLKRVWEQDAVALIEQKGTREVHEKNRSINRCNFKRMGWRRGWDLNPKG